MLISDLTLHFHQPGLATMHQTTCHTRWTSAFQFLWKSFTC